MAASICRADGEFIAIKVLNINHHPAHLSELAALATIEAEVEVQIKGAPAHSGLTWDNLTMAQRNVLEQCEIDPEKRLSAEHVKRVKDLLAKHLSVFAPDPKNPGHTHLVEVSLDLIPGSKPHRHAPSRLGGVGDAMVKEMIDGLEAVGIVRKSQSPWASRLVIVKKKDGSNRICIDLRQVTRA